MAQMPRRGSSFYKLIQQLLNDIFVAERRRLNKSIEDLVKANNELCATPNNVGFLFAGEYYTVKGNMNIPKGTPSHKLQKEALHPELTTRMEWHVTSAQTVADDERTLGMMLYKLLDPCETLQDMRNTLPDYVAVEIPTLKSMPRNGEVGFTLESDSDREQWEELLPKLEFYVAARLMY